MIRGKSILLIIAVVLLLWANAIPGDFVYDDFALIVSTPFIKSPQKVASLFSKNYIASPVNDFFYRGVYHLGSGESTYRPVATLSYFLNYAVFGLKPWGYRLTNVLLHACNALLVYFLLLLLFGKPRLALLSALLFGAHPVSAEVIACAGFRPNILALLFSLLAIILYFKAALPASFKRYLYLTLSLLCYLLAVFSKEIAVFLPLALLACEYYRQNRNFRKALLSWKIYLWYLAIALLYLGIYFFLMPPSQNIFDSTGWFKNTVRMTDIFGRYLKIMIFPQDLVMVPPMAMRKSYFNIALGAAFLLGCGYVFLKRRRFPPELSFGLLWFLIWLFPMNNFLNSFRILLANRFLYLSLPGLAVVIAALLVMPEDKKNILTRRLPSLKYILPAACLGYFSIFTLSNNALWKNELLVCLSVAQKYPRSSSAHVDLGEAWFKRGNFPEALNEFDIALTRAGGKIATFDFTRIYADAGSIYMSGGEYKKAEENYRQAIRLAPDMPYFYLLLAGCYGRQRLYDKALKELEAAKKINPEFSPAYLKSGVIYALMQRYQDARREFEQALKLQPNCEEARLSLETLEHQARRKR